MNSTLDNNPFTTLKHLKMKLKDESNLEVSESSASEGIFGNTEVSKRSGCYVDPPKKASKRDQNSNSLPQEYLRKDRVKELSQCLADGFGSVWVDKTRFDAWYVRVKEWSKKGKRLYINWKNKVFSCSGIIAIGHNGMLNYSLVRGKVTVDVYDSFLDHLVVELKKRRIDYLWDG